MAARGLLRRSARRSRLCVPAQPHTWRHACARVLVLGKPRSTTNVCMHAPRCVTGGLSSYRTHAAPTHTLWEFCHLSAGLHAVEL